MELNHNQTVTQANYSDSSNTFDLKMVIALLLSFILLCFLYRETFVYLLNEWSQWQHGEYAHGFAVLAVAIFMIWGLRKELFQVDVAPSLYAIPLVLLFSLSWMIGVLVGIRVIESISLFMLLPSLIYGLAGKQFVLRLWFPIAFILVALPVWDPALPFLQDIAASISYLFVKLTGISILREGAYLSIPAGQFLIAEGCSGLRYLLAAMTFGGFYIYLERLTHWRACTFFAVVVAAAIIANALRITVVVIAGQMTNMQHPWIHDHLGLGWYIFAGMLVPVFWIGIKLSRMQQTYDEAAVMAPHQVHGSLNSEHQAKPRLKAFMILLPILILALLSGPGVRRILLERTNLSESSIIPLNAPNGIDDWKKIEFSFANNKELKPVFDGADHIIDQVYSSGDNKVRLYVASYLSQRQDKEMINVNNVLYHEERWQPVTRKVITLSKVSTQDADFQVSQTHLKSNSGAEYLFWSWYRSSGFTTTRPVFTKFYDLYGLVTGRVESSVVMVGMKKIDDIEKTNEVLRQFVYSMEKEIDRELDKLTH